MRRILFLIYVLGIPCGSWAQTDQASQASWEKLNALRAGQKIQFVEMTSKKHPGTFVNVSDTAITYQEATGEQTIQKQDVRSVKLMKNTHRLRNALIGAAMGAGVGAGVGIATSCSQDTCFFARGLGAAVGAVVGLLPGAIVGALVPGHETIYSVNSQEPWHHKGPKTRGP